MASVGFSTVVQVNDGAASAYVAFTNVTKVKTPAADIGSVEDTHIASSGRARTFQAGMIDNGMLEFTQRWDVTAWSRVIALSYTSHGWKVIFPDNTTASFSGFVTNFEVGEVVNDQIIDFTVKVKVSGLVTVA